MPQKIINILNFSYFVLLGIKTIKFFRLENFKNLILNPFMSKKCASSSSSVLI
jgi:hypothetical protein